MRQKLRDRGRRGGWFASAKYRLGDRDENEGEIRKSVTGFPNRRSQGERKVDFEV